MILSTKPDWLEPVVLVHLRTTVRMWAADASRVDLVSDWKRLELKHMCFAVCRSSARERAFSGPKSPDAPEPYFRRNVPTGPNGTGTLSQRRTRLDLLRE